MSMEANGIFNVFQTDAWMTKSSHVFKGTFGTLEKDVKAILKNGEFDDDWLNEQDENVLDEIRTYLLEHKQTPQCGDINYIIEERELNEWEDSYSEDEKNEKIILKTRSDYDKRRFQRSYGFAK